MNDPEQYFVFEFEKGISKTKQLVNKIITAIKNKQLTPGQQLPAYRRQQKLTGLSYTLIVKAGKQLQSAGYVAADQRKRIYVRQIETGKEIRGLTEEASYPVRLVEPLDVLPSCQIRNKIIRFDLDVPYPDPSLEAKKKSKCRTAYTNSFPGNYAAQEAKVVSRIAENLARFSGVSIKQRQCSVIRGANTALTSLFSVLHTGEKKRLVIPHTIAPSVYRACMNSPFKVEKLENADNSAFTMRLHKRGRFDDVAAVVVEPRLDYYTGSEMSMDDRLALLDLADKYRFPVIEVDYDHEFLQGRPLPLFAVDQKNSILVSCVSKMDYALYDLKYVCGPVNVVRSLRNLSYSNSMCDDSYLRSVDGILKGFSVSGTSFSRVNEIVFCGEELVKYLEPWFRQEVLVMYPGFGPAIFLRFPKDTDMVQMKEILKKWDIVIGTGFWGSGTAGKLLRLSLLGVNRKTSLKPAAERLCAAYARCRGNERSL